ncbi:MAG TPA: FxsA family protein [Casimicrobiaceae bacterium]|nr:FxsA family protein [Casimicrobiaceae bacterium]
MRFLVLLIVLAFPVIDVMATLRFARWTGVPALAWILASTVAGLLLLHHERLAFRARALAALRGDRPLMRGLIDSGRKVLAALFLILPGVLSDLIAILLLLFPINVGAPFSPQTVGAGYGARRSDALDGDYRRVD